MKRSADMKSSARRKNIQKLLRKFHWKCAICGCAVFPGTGNEDCRPQRATIDHIVPQFLGGSNRFENLQLACYSCNSKKGAAERKLSLDIRDGKLGRE